MQTPANYNYEIMETTTEGVMIKTFYNGIMKLVCVIPNDKIFIIFGYPYTISTLLKTPMMQIGKKQQAVYEFVDKYYQSQRETQATTTNDQQTAYHQADPPKKHAKEITNEPTEITLENVANEIQSILPEKGFLMLQNQILNWANERNLLKEENATNQLCKVMEELGELSSALLKGNELALKDAFGDVLVTLIILCKQKGLDLLDCLDLAYNEIKDRKGQTINGTFIKE